MPGTDKTEAKVESDFSPSGGEPTTQCAPPGILFGDIAIDERMVTPEQLAEALRDQENDADPQPLGEILLRKGSLQPEQLRSILEIQGRRLRGFRQPTLETLESSLFGKTVIQLGLASEQQVNEGIRFHATRRGKGERVLLGEVLVEKGALTAYQVKRVLQRQRREILFCSSCHVQYSIHGMEPGQIFPCRSCNVELKVPDPLGEPATDTPSFSSSAALPESEPLGVALTDHALGDFLVAPGEIRGEVFGEYRILKKIARGGMGIVYQAVQAKLDRVVALKILAAGEEATEEQLHRFRLEASSAANLNHPYIVPIHDVGEVDGRHYFTMDFVKGRTLARIMKRGGLPIREALIITKKVAEALDYAHSQGIVHRDIKPGNIIIDRYQNPRITDFGLVKDLLSDSSVTREGLVMGTPAYISPEQAAGDEGLDGRADVYSLGAVLYELLTSHKLVKSDSSAQVVTRIIRMAPVGPRSLNPSIHRDVETICLKAIEKQPGKRYPTAGAMQRDIERYLNGEVIKARPVGWVEHVWRKVLQNKGTSATAAMALVMALGFAGLAISAKAQAERAILENSYSRVTRARELLGKGNIQAARLEFEKALTLDPDSREARNGLDDAERSLRIRRDHLIDEGRLFFRRGELANAERGYRAALRIDRESEEAGDGLDAVKYALAEEEGRVAALRSESDRLLREGRDRAAQARLAPPESAGAIYVDAVILMRQAVAMEPSAVGESSTARRDLFDILIEAARLAIDRKSFELSSFLLNEAVLLNIDSARVRTLQMEIDQTTPADEVPDASPARMPPPDRS